MIKRFASHYLFLSVDDFRKLQIVELDDNGLMLRYFQLTRELHSVNWLGGIFILSDIPDYILDSGLSFPDLVSLLTSGLRPDSPAYVYHLDGVDLDNHSTISGMTLKRLV